MQTTIPSSDAFNWVIAPAGQCVIYIAEEITNAAILQRAVTALAYQGPMLQITREHKLANRQDIGGIDQLLAEQNGGLEKSAKELIASDYESINRHGIIGLWVAVEVAVEDTVALVLTKVPSTQNLVTAAGVKLPKVLSNPLTESDARKIYGRLEAFSRQGVSVAEGYTRLLSILQISMTLPADVILTLAELNYVRNCLLHRAGIVDERAATEAPGLSLPLGSSIKVSSARYGQYFDAVGKFSGALYDAVVQSPYLRTQAQSAP